MVVHACVLCVVQRDVRLPYEDRVTADTFVAEDVNTQVASWKTYIKVELGEDMNERCSQPLFHDIFLVILR